jgi:hypothetical protein
MLATFKLQMRLAKRRARLKNRADRPAHAARRIVRRGKRQRRSKNSSALNKKIVTWRPASQEIAGEKGPKRQWGLPIVGNGGMCAEQRADYQAACDGKIAWSAYFAKWGPKL